MLRQENFESVQLLRNPFDIIQAIHTDDNFAVLETAFELLQPRLNSGALDAFDELPRINPNREGSNLGIPAFELDAVGLGLESEDAGTRRQEVSGIVISVESTVSLARSPIARSRTPTQSGHIAERPVESRVELAGC